MFVKHHPHTSHTYTTITTLTNYCTSKSHYIEHQAYRNYKSCPQISRHFKATKDLIDFSPALLSNFRVVLINDT